MLFEVVSNGVIDKHKWAVLRTECDLADGKDPLLLEMGNSFKQDYGEGRILKLAQPDATIESRFDLSAIKNAMQRALPDPASESKKPQQLANYRSETAELIARKALSEAFEIQFPVNPQITKLNVNQPVLGFDGWGFDDDPVAGLGLVLVQVKGTDDEDRPPSQAALLIGECSKALDDDTKLIRVLTVFISNSDEGECRDAAMRMLVAFGKGTDIRIVLAPVIVRGKVAPQIEDLTTLQDSCKDASSLPHYGICVGVGVDLADFGQKVLELAKAA